MVLVSCLCLGLFARASCMGLKVLQRLSNPGLSLCAGCCKLLVQCLCLLPVHAPNGI